MTERQEEKGEINSATNYTERAIAIGHKAREAYKQHLEEFPLEGWCSWERPHL
jgi:hypothetical protein